MLEKNIGIEYRQRKSVGDSHFDTDDQNYRHQYCDINNHPTGSWVSGKYR